MSLCPCQAYGYDRPMSRLTAIVGDRRRVLLGLALLLVYVVLAVRIYSVLSFSVGKVPFGVDAYAYIGGGRAYAQGIDPVGINLNPLVPEAPFEVPPYLYPPPLGVAMMPLTLLPFRIGMALWLIGVLATTIALSVLLRRWTGWLAAIAAVWLFLPTWESLWLGQINALIALLVLLTIVAAQRDDDRSGAWLAAGTLLKIVPALGLPVLVLHRRWRAVLLALGVIAAVFAVTLPIVPLESWYRGFVYAAISAEPSPQHVSWPAFFRQYPQPIPDLIGYGLPLLLIGVTLWRSRAITMAWGVSAMVLLPLLAARVVWEAHMIIVLPVLALCWAAGRRGQILAATAWIGITLLGGIVVPMMLTLIWVACCWPQLLDRPVVAPTSARALRSAATAPSDR